MDICRSPWLRALWSPMLAVAVVVLAGACSAGSAGEQAPRPAATVTVTAPAPSVPATTAWPAITATPGGIAAPASTPGVPGSAAGTAARCDARNLRVSTGPRQGAAGPVYTHVVFTNTARSACVVTGFPAVSLVSAGSGAGRQVGAGARRIMSAAVRPVTLAAGRAAHAVLGVAAAGNFPAGRCGPVTAHWLKVFPPGQAAAAYARFTTRTCASASVPTLTVSAVSPGS